MPIKARPFRTKIDDAVIEGFFDGSDFVFRFYELVEFRPPVLSVGEDEWGNYAVLKDTEVSYADGFTIRVEIGVNDMLECESGYVLTFRRSDLGDRKLVESLLREKEVDPDSAIVVIPPRKSFSLSFNPRGEIDGSSQLLDSSEFLTKTGFSGYHYSVLARPARMVR